MTDASTNHPPPEIATSAADAQKTLRGLIYVYVLLWIFEGALRKWILPGLSAPLLVVRDPILLAIYFGAFRQKIFSFDPFTSSILLLGGLAVIVSVGLTDAPPLKVIAYGFRSNFLHLPLIFLLPRILSYKHVRFLGVLILWLAVPMALLVALQFLSPPMGYLNAGAGGGEGGMLETANGRIRPSGTFSFTNGMAGFTAIIAAFLLHHLLERNVFHRFAIMAAIPALLVMVLLSGSRTTFGLVVLLLLAVLAIWIIQPRYVKSSLKFFALVASFSVLRTGMAVLAERFGNKKNVREGFIGRFFNEFQKPITAIVKAEPFGVGIGMGTNVASSLIFGKVRFNFGESDWDRIINEMGPVLGLMHIFWRLAASIFVIRCCFLVLRKEGNTLPLLLCTAGLADLIQGQLGQATTLGYVCIAAGLALAATRRDEITLDFIEPAAPATNNLLRTRSRSAYSAQLIPEEQRVAAAPVSEKIIKPVRGRSSYSGRMHQPRGKQQS